jgi:preprotein translocase subunit SecA
LKILKKSLCLLLSFFIFSQNLLVSDFSKAREIKVNAAPKGILGTEGKVITFRNTWGFTLPICRSSNNKFVETNIDTTPQSKEITLKIIGERAYFEGDEFYIPTKFVTPLREVERKNSKGDKDKVFVYEPVCVSTIRKKIKLFRQKNPYKNVVESEDELELVKEVTHKECPYITIRGFTGNYYTTDYFGDNSKMLFVRFDDLKGALTPKKHILTQTGIDVIPARVAHTQTLFEEQEAISRKLLTVSNKIYYLSEFIEALKPTYIDPKSLKHPSRNVGIYTESCVQCKQEEHKKSRNTWWFDIPVFDPLNEILPEGIEPNQEFEIFKISEQKTYITPDLMLWIPTRFTAPIMLCGAEGKLYLDKTKNTAENRSRYKPGDGSFFAWKQSKLSENKPKIDLYVMKNWRKAQIESDEDLSLFSGALKLDEEAIRVKGRAGGYVSFGLDGQTVFIKEKDFENPLILDKWYGFSASHFLRPHPKDPNPSWLQSSLGSKNYNFSNLRTYKLRSSSNSKDPNSKNSSPKNLDHKNLSPRRSNSRDPSYKHSNSKDLKFEDPDSKDFSFKLPDPKDSNFRYPVYKSPNFKPSNSKHSEFKDLNSERSSSKNPTSKYPDLKDLRFGESHFKNFNPEHSEFKDSSSKHSDSKDLDLKDSPGRSSFKHSNSKDLKFEDPGSKDFSFKLPDPKDSNFRYPVYKSPNSKPSSSKYSEFKGLNSERSSSKNPTSKDPDLKDLKFKNLDFKNLIPRRSNSKDPSSKHSNSKDYNPDSSLSLRFHPTNSKSSKSQSHLEISKSRFLSNFDNFSDDEDHSSNKHNKYNNEHSSSSDSEYDSKSSSGSDSEYDKPSSNPDYENDGEYSSSNDEYNSEYDDGLSNNLDDEFENKYDSDSDDAYDSGFEHPMFPLPDKLPKYMPTSDQVTVKDLIEFDASNAKYAHFVTDILNNIKIPAYVYQAPNVRKTATDLNALTLKLTKIFKKIYFSDKITKEKGHQMCPHPVQVLSVLRLADEILNVPKKGAIAEIKTGEGKSFIIAALSILLVKCARKIDISTSNMELACRDQREQKVYYDLFGISSDVLYNVVSDQSFINYESGTKHGSSDICKYSLDSLKASIVYSTQHNYEWLYLTGLFYVEPLRKRAFDIIIVDEADCALLDEASAPASISAPIKTKDCEKICRLVFGIIEQNQNSNLQNIAKRICQKFPDAKINEKNVTSLVKGALISLRERRGETYVVKEGKIQLIQRATGFLQPDSRWNEFLHLMIEIKEGQNVRSPGVTLSSIHQRDFVMLYRSICGVTGTVGTPEDVRTLQSTYNVNIFAVPKNIESKKDIIQNGRSSNIQNSYSNIAREARQISKTGRPILIFFDYPREVDEFADRYFPNAKRIKGLLEETDKVAIEAAGRPGQITIATPAAGRGTDIKLHPRSEAAGGLHVIIAKIPKTKRALEQAIGRSGRQGKPGSATILLAPYEVFYNTNSLASNSASISALQTRFASYIKGTYPWLFSNTPKQNFENFELLFGSDYKDVLRDSCNFTIKMLFPPKISLNKFDEEILTGYLHHVILISWGMFFGELMNNSNLSKNTQDYESLYTEFVTELHVWLPKDARSSVALLFGMQKQSVKHFVTNVDWKKVVVQISAVAGATMLIVLASSVCPGVSIALPVTIINAALEGATSIYEQMTAPDGDGQVNLKKVAVRAAGGAVKGYLFSTGSGIFATSVGLGAAEAATTFMEGNIDGEDLVNNIGRSLKAGFFTGVTNCAGSVLREKYGPKIIEKLKVFRERNGIPKDGMKWGLQAKRSLVAHACDTSIFTKDEIKRIVTAQKKQKLPSSLKISSNRRQLPSTSKRLSNPSETKNKRKKTYHSNHRRAWKEYTGREAQYHIHHGLPREFKLNFEKYGLDVRDPQFFFDVPPEKHIYKSGGGIHTNSSPLGSHWNKVWKNFFDYITDPTRELILRQLDKMAKKAGIEKYRARPK